MYASLRQERYKKNNFDEGLKPAPIYTLSDGRASPMRLGNGSNSLPWDSAEEKPNR